ncbi:peptidase family M1-domain-containing protein [Geopyxis carbonaria]|nr:peptidase family M1-domain-containing protein [Geopyxis carbonaria]
MIFSVKPTHYKLDLRNLNFDTFEYDGSVEIHLIFQQSQNKILLNCKELCLKDDGYIQLASSDRAIAVQSIHYDLRTEVVTLDLSEDLPNSGEGVMYIKFTGKLNQEMAGFYRSAYKNAEGENDWMYSTQFESCDARRAFPCFDEPNLKATFDLSIEIPESYTALSNQPEKFSESVGHGLKRVTFLTAPKMSTYLYAWACGNFEYIEAFTEREYSNRGRIPVRVYTTRGLVHQGIFALENARKIVDYFSEIFDIEYPLPKLDLLAVHEFSHGAMENWGLITYRTTAVLFNEKTSDARYKNRVAIVLIKLVVAHELAHQWFGNLVTMDWWSELWLNEGFATWVGWLATDHFYPEWDVWGQFVTEGLQTAFQLDGLRGSHPVEVPVKNALEIDQIFDHISYLKGSGTIRMLSSYLGQEKFLRGVSNYLKKHSYGNATTEDLWSALGEISGVDIASYMRNWIKLIGFPFLTVLENPGQITIKQSRFLSTGDVSPLEDATTWWVPLMLNESSVQQISALESKEITIQGLDMTNFKLNNGQTGFYRVNYSEDRLLHLGKMQGKLTVSDKVGLISDAAAMAFAGHRTTAGLLNFLYELKDETNYFVWASITAQLTNLRSLFGQVVPEIEDRLKRVSLDLLTPIVEKLGWDFKPDEDFLVVRLRALIISAAGSAGHIGVITEAKRRFKLYISGEDRSAIHPNLRLAVFRIAMAEGGQAEYDAIITEFHSTITVDGREICLAALGCTQDPAVVLQVLDLILSESVKVQDKHTPAISLSNNGSARYKLWNFVRESWPKVYKQMSGNMVVLDRFLKNSLNKFAQEKEMHEIRDFFNGKDNTGYDKGLNVVYDSIRGNSNYVSRDQEVLEEWLKSRGY